MNQEIVFKKGITRLCHFTKSSNLPYILGTGDEEANGIISNKAIRDSECKFLKLNDIHRYDNRPELICLSVEYPNFFFFEKSIENTKIKEAHYMCDVIHAMIDEGVERGRKEGREEGIQKGKLEGANIIIRLYEILLNEGSMDKLKRATKDESYRYELLKEYHLI